MVYHLWTRSHRPAFFQDAVLAADRASEGLNTVGMTGDSLGKEVVILNSKQLVHDLRIQSEQRIRSLLGVGNVLLPDMTCPIERRYGLGDTRSLSEFENRIGVSFSTQTIKDLGPPAGMRFCSDDVSDILGALSLSLMPRDVEGKGNDSANCLHPVAVRVSNGGNDTLSVLNLVQAYLRS